MSTLLLLKAFHIVGFTAWFGGLFYLVRIFVYHRESFDRTAEDQRVLIPQYQIMEDRVYRIICLPGMIITWLCGLALLYILGLAWLKINTWMHIKLVLLVGLTIYTFSCRHSIRQLSDRKISWTSFHYRLYNEVPTLFLLSIVMLAVFRNLLHIGYALLIVLAFGILMFLFAKWYKKIRQD